MNETRGNKFVAQEQLIPPPELAPPAPAHLTTTQRMAVWLDLVDSAEELLLAGLRHQIGPDGDLRAAYRRWEANRKEEHDRALRQMAANMMRRSTRHDE